MTSQRAPAIDDRGVIVACASCGKANRVPFQRLAEVAQCADCKEALPAPGYPIQVESASSFHAMVSRSGVPLLVDFWAPWCGPCKMVAPAVEEVAAGAGRQFLVAKVNTEDQPRVAGQFGIRSIPTFIL